MGDEKKIDPAQIRAQFREALGIISYARAGWDYYDMPLAQKLEEGKMEERAWKVVRTLWREHPEMRTEFEAVLKEGWLMERAELDK